MTYMYYIHVHTCTRMYIVVQTNIPTSHLADEAIEQTLGKHLSARQQANAYS